MNSSAAIHQKRRLLLIGMALTGVAGFVDALGYLKYFQIFTANMSGNHIRLGIDIIDAQWHDAFLRLLPIGSFALGVVVGELCLHGQGSPVRMRAVAPLWALEAAILLSVIGGDRWIPPSASRDEWLLALLAVALGVQNTTLRRTRSLTLYTTHVTGALTAACIWLASALKATLQRLSGQAAKSPPVRYPSSIWRAGLPLSYTAGAAAGAWGLRLVHVNALCFPALALLFLAGTGRVGISRDHGAPEASGPVP